MQVGIEGKKGRVVYRLTPTINRDIDELLKEQPTLQEAPRNEQIQAVCNLIDKHIHQAYEIYDRGEEFEQYLQGQLEKIHLPNKDDMFLMEKMREMYAKPIENYYKAI